MALGTLEESWAVIPGMEDSTETPVVLPSESRDEWYVQYTILLECFVPSCSLQCAMQMFAMVGQYVLMYR